MVYSLILDLLDGLPKLRRGKVSSGQETKSAGFRGTRDELRGTRTACHWRQ